MSDAKITELPASTGISPSVDVVPIVHASVTQQATVQALVNSGLVNPGSIGFTPTGTLTSTTVQGALAEISTELASSTGSSLVGHIGTGTGAVSRTVQSKLRDTVSVKDFGAIGDGVTDDSAAFQAVVDYVGSSGKTIYVPDGTYKIGTNIIPPNGASFELVGASKIGTVIKGGVGNVIFTSDTSVASPKLVANVVFRDLTFDGEHVRGTFPYASFGSDSYTMLMPIVLSASATSTTSSVEVHSCKFVRIPNLPILVSHFSRTVVTNCEFYKTRDPGFKYCKKVVFSNNTTTFGSDNFVSISRGCKNVAITGNIFKESESSGIWVAGFDVAGSGTVTAFGTYTSGGSVTLTRSTGSWSVDDINTPVTLTSGANKATFQITSVSTSLIANGIAASAVPAPLQNTAAVWSYAPHVGTENVTIANNTIVGGYTSGIYGASGGRRVSITNNNILRTGYVADSEKFTVGSIASGSTSLVVDNGAIFANNDYIILDPYNSFGEYLIAQASTVAGNTLTLSAAPTRTYARVTVYLCHINASARAVVVTGSNSGSEFYEGGKGIIANNYIENFVEMGVLLGSSLGTVSNMSVASNVINVTNTIGAPSRTAIKISESVEGNASNINIANNTYIDGAGGNMLNFAQNDTTPRSSIVIDGNAILGSATKTAGDANSYLSRWVLNGSRQRVSNIDFDTWNVVAVSTNNVLITSSLTTLNETGVATVNNFTKPASAELSVFWVRNNSASNVTITHNTSLIRALGATNIVLATNETAGFIFVASTIVQQISGPFGGGTVAGNLTVQGNTTLGDAFTDTFNVTASAPKFSLMSSTDTEGTLVLGRATGTDRDSIIAVFNSATVASNYIRFQVHNGTLGARINAMTLFGNGSVALLKTITAGGTTGAQTINNPSGSVNFAAAATSLVVTNSLVSTSSVILCTVGTNDTTMKSALAVAAAGSFTIFANAAATAETRVNFLVFN
jgi:Pectate lyase superfamily protein